MIRIKLRNKTLKETPLYDIVDYNNHREDDDFENKSSIAHRADKSFKAHAKLLWKDSEHNWILVTPANVLSFSARTWSGGFESDAKDKLEQWVRLQNFPSPSKILVVSSSPYENDFDSPEWTTGHDIIGHTIESKFNVFTAASRFNTNLILQKFVGRETDLIYEIWKMLPKNLQLDTTATDNGNKEDTAPDILFGFFSKQLVPEQVAERLTNVIKENTEFPNMAEVSARQMTKFFVEAVQNFIKIVPDDKPFFVRPF